MGGTWSKLVELGEKGYKAMMPSQTFSSLAPALLDGVRGDPYWEEHLHDVVEGQCSHSAVHIAIFVEPYLRYVLDGRKTVESRFSSRRCTPYHAVQRGDILLLKRSGGPIVGLCEVSEVWYYQLDPDSWHTIRQEFTQALCAQDPAFWTDRAAASFATLMRVRCVRAIAPVEYVKKDRRGWVVVQTGQLQPQLSGFA